MQEANLEFQKANEHLAKREWDLAIAGMQTSLQICPDHVVANRGVGRAMMG